MRQPHKGKKGSLHIGRLRLRAAMILSKGLGFTVLPEHIRPAKGAWRTNASLDVYRWEILTYDDRGMAISGGCWETLTEFVKEAAKHGCHINSQGEIEAGEKN